MWCVLSMICSFHSFWSFHLKWHSLNQVTRVYVLRVSTCTFSYCPQSVLVHGHWSNSLICMIYILLSTAVPIKYLHTYYVDILSKTCGDDLPCSPVIPPIYYFTHPNPDTHRKSLGHHPQQRRTLNGWKVSAARTAPLQSGYHTVKTVTPCDALCLSQGVTSLCFVGMVFAKSTDSDKDSLIDSVNLLLIGRLEALDEH